MININKVKESKSINELLNFSIINMDKPCGPTSFSVSDYIRKSLKISKTSHFGTLDPAVSGVLPIALGRACRLNDYFMHRDKTYVGIMRLHKEDVKDEELNKAIKKYLGKIKQLPPVRSAVKRQIREREIKLFEIIERDNKDILFKTVVQAGTYIRTLCVQIGEEIGGAHMLELRRTQAGMFEENLKEYPIINLYDFDKAIEEYKSGNESPLKSILIPAEIVSILIPVIQITDKLLLKKLLTGRPLMKSDIKPNNKMSEKFCVFNKDIFIGIYRVVSEVDIIARPEFVFN